MHITGYIPHATRAFPILFIGEKFAVYTICKRHTDKTSRDHSQFACCNQTVTTINKWWTPLSSLVFMGLCVCARILNHNMVKYTLQLCRKEMTVVMEFLIENLKSHMWVANDKFTPVRTRFE